MAGNLFLNSKDYIGQNDVLNYINYESISEGHKEFLRTDVWDWDWTVPPAAVYFPGNDLLKTRTISVMPQFPVAIGMMQAVIRQFTIQQSTLSGTTAGSLSIEYHDLEDQAINLWLDDWREKLGTREDRFSFRKEDTIAHGRLLVMNSTRRPIRSYSVRTVQPSDIGQGISPQLTSDDPQDAGNISTSFNFEHYSLEWKNI